MFTALVPILQGNENRPGIGFSAAADEIDPGDVEEIFDIGIVANHLVELCCRGLGALQAGTVGQHQRTDHVALIFRRHKATGDDAEHEEAAGDDDDAGRRTDDAVVEGFSDRCRVKVGKRRKSAIERLEQHRFLVLLLEQQGAQRRGQRQGDDPGERHRNRHGDGKLPVELSGDAAKESDRNENRTQHQHDGHDRAGNFAHRLYRRVMRIHVLRSHQPFDVLQHHDGIVDDDADGQHHGKQGQGVDREAEQVKSGKGANQRYRHGNQWNDRRPPVLQEDKNDNGHQHHRLAQGIEHFLDRSLNKLGGIERDKVINVTGEFL